MHCVFLKLARFLQNQQKWPKNHQKRVQKVRFNTATCLFWRMQLRFLRSVVLFFGGFNVCNFVAKRCLNVLLL